MKNIFKNSLIFILFYFSILFRKDLGGDSFAQTNKIDSLLSLIKKDNPDTNKVNHLNILCSEFINAGLYDTAIHFASNAFSLAEQLSEQSRTSAELRGIKKKIADAFNNIGIAYYYQADFQKTLEYWMKALKIIEELGDKNEITTFLGNIGAVYIMQGVFPKALDCFFKALKIDEELKNKKGIASRLGNIGVVYNRQEDYSKALNYNFKALKMAEELGDKNLIAMNLGNIGIVYYKIEDFPKALTYYFKALKIAEELGDKKGIIRHLDNIGVIFEGQKDYPKAIDYYLKALKMAEDLGDKKLIAAILNNMGSLYTTTGKFKDAEQFLKRSITIADSIGAMNDLRIFEESLSKLYDTMGQHKEAFIHYKKAITLKDTLFSQENKKQLVRKEMNYEFDKKEAITKAENEKQVAVAEEKNRRQKIITWSVALGLFLVMVFAGFIVRSLRITSKQKKIIESQNFQIVESINYSKKIQDSLLPSIDSMKKAIPDLFVFYEPKAIVSGDFYYFKQFEKYTLLACVDCTGHGVPGGFMSTLGSLLLDKIADNEELSPSEILNKLSDEIIRVLHQQNGGEIQDGMDLSICLIDRNNKKIEFSGARNGIIVVTNEQAKRYKADPLPVGGNYIKKGIAIERNFKTQHIPINANDWVYMYTDGFMEQVGGSDGIPMNYSQFEDQLINVSKTENPQEKNKLLQLELDNWRGTHERDDDVLIMGFQV